MNQATHIEAVVDPQEQLFLHDAATALGQPDIRDHTEPQARMTSMRISETLIRDVHERLAHALRAVPEQTWHDMTDSDVAVVMFEATNTALAGHALHYLPESRRSALNVQFFREAMRRGLPDWIVRFAPPEVQADAEVQADVAASERQRQERLQEILSRKAVD